MLKTLVLLFLSTVWISANLQITTDWCQICKLLPTLWTLHAHLLYRTNSRITKTVWKGCKAVKLHSFIVLRSPMWSLDVCSLLSALYPITRAADDPGNELIFYSEERWIFSEEKHTCRTERFFRENFHPIWRFQNLLPLCSTFPAVQPVGVMTVLGWDPSR